jgi:hypothetical protein
VGSFDRWAERIYSENDVGRSIATAAAGAAGLVVYLTVRDWVVAAFSAIIIFPLVRLVSTAVQSKLKATIAQRTAQDHASKSFQKLTDQEHQVVQAFVEAGGCVLTWSHVNQLHLPYTAIESLIQRGVLTTSMAADSMTETFVLDSVVFDASVAQASGDKPLTTRSTGRSPATRVRAG